MEKLKKESCITGPVSCFSCQTTEGVIKYGSSAGRGQRYRCKHCRITFSLGSVRGTYDPAWKEKISQLYCHTKTKAQEIVQQFHISTATLISRAKKHKRQCPDCTHTMD